MKKTLLNLLALASTLSMSVHVTVGQNRTGRPLESVDLNQVWHSTPGQVPQHSLAYNPLVAEIISQTNLDSLVSFVRILSGEDSVVVGAGKVLIRNRGTQEGSDVAAEYLKEKLASYNLEVHDQAYSGTGRNIYAKQVGYLYPEKEYVICAHYDAVSTNNADDNASGAAGVLEAARILSAYGTKYTVIYAFWDEEEIGLVGSHYFASQASSNQEQIQGVLNLDMIGWDANDDYLADIHTQNTASSNDIANLLVVTDYLYNLPVKPIIYNPGTWQSDHSSFWNRGFGAVLLIEAYYGGDLNPYYHTDGDSVGNFNLPFFHSMAKLTIAAMSTLAEATNDTLIISVVPDVGYQTYQADIHIKGLNTHFQREPGTTKVWLSMDAQVLDPDSIRISSDTSLTAYYSIRRDAGQGWWKVHVETSVDGIVTKTNGFHILPPPPVIAVSPDSLSVRVQPGTTQTVQLSIENQGEGDLQFAIIGPHEENLLAYYPFNGNANDKSGNNHHGVVNGTTLTSDRFGNPNNAYQFDGVNDDIELGTWFKYYVFTVTFWISPGDVQTWWASIIDNNHSYYTNWTIQQSEGVLNTYVFATLNERKLFGLATNTWQHLAIVRDTTRSSIVYVNGRQIGLPVHTGDINYGNPPFLILGSWYAGGSKDRFWKGIMDEIRIYDRALSEVEISHLALNFSIYEGRISAEPSSGSVSAGSSAQIILRIDATQVELGEYVAHLGVQSNDPKREYIQIPLKIVVDAFVGGESNELMPSQYSLGQNFPNPFNPTTTIKYELPYKAHVSLKVFNVLGQEVAVLVDKEESAGYKSVAFNASTLPSGIYFYSLTAGDFVATQKCILIR